MVAIPPIVAAIGIPRSSAFAKPDCFPRDKRSGMTAAKTIAVVAVLDISMEAVIVVIIKPMSRFLGFVPDIFRVNLKRVSSSFVLVIADARKKPPSISQITLLENVCTYFSIFSGDELKYLFPSANTRNAMMNKLTANAGIASVSHKPMAKKSRKMTYTCESVNPGSLRRNVNPIAMTRDSRKEIIDLLRLELAFFIR
jgi:hypothetical protein